MNKIKITLSDGQTFIKCDNSHFKGANLLRFDIADMYAEDVAGLVGIDIYADDDDNYVVYNGVRMLNEDFNDMVVKLEVIKC